MALCHWIHVGHVWKFIEISTKISSYVLKQQNKIVKCFFFRIFMGTRFFLSVSYQHYHAPVEDSSVVFITTG